MNTFSLKTKSLKTKLLNTKLMFGMLALLISAPAFSHSGHDHSAANAGLIHLLWLAPVILAMVVISYRKIKTKSDNK